MVELVNTYRKGYSYGGAYIEPGGVFYANRRDARMLMAVKRAKEYQAPDMELPEPPVERDRPSTDEHGVEFNARMCDDSGPVMFYKKGSPKAGQWRKRRDVPQKDYDEWYAGRRRLYLNRAMATTTT